MTTEVEPELPIEDQSALLARAESEFIRKALEAGMAPTVVQKFIIIPVGEDRFNLALGSAGLFGALGQNGDSVVPLTPSAGIAFSASVSRQFLIDLAAFIQNQFAITPPQETEV